MRILVCVKQVPATNQVKVDPETGVLLRQGVESKLNPYDLFAIETALCLRERYGGTVTALSMGPPQAERALRECYSMGCDDAALLSDRRFGGADVLATSYVLAEGIRALGGFDLILCGKQTTDGDTAQVGSELAELLNLPGAAGVRTVEEVTPTQVTIELDLGHAVARAELRLPCVLSMDKDVCRPRLPSYRKKQASADRAVRVLSLADLPGAEESRCGLSGSPTQVRRIFPPDEREGQVYHCGSSDETAAALAQTLRSLKFL